MLELEERKLTEHMFENALNAAKSLEKTRSSKYDALFSNDERAKLNEFTVWLISKGFKNTSASSYRANFSRATAKKFENLTSDERSALRKFNEFMSATKK